MADKQPKALRLAQGLNNRQECEDDAADELRRLYEENQSLRAELAQAEPVQDLIPPDSLFVCDQMGAHVTRVRLAQQAEPVQRKPLTEDEIEALFKGVDSKDKGRFAIVRGFARAIEAAHGIKGGGNG